MSHDNMKHCYVSLPNELKSECILVLVKIGMIRHINLIDGIPSGKFETDHDFLKPTRHIPSTNPTHDCNTIPVEGYPFAQLRSVQNVQSQLYSPGANKYIC